MTNAKSRLGLSIRRRSALLSATTAVLLIAFLLLPVGCGETASTITSSRVASTTAPASGIPKLLDLGSVGCIPCDMMVGELDALAQEYPGVIEVRFVDVNKTAEGSALASELRIRVIPTQIFFDAEGNELGRHEGYISKDDMVRAFEEFGCPLAKPSAASKATATTEAAL